MINFKSLAIFCGYAVRFESSLVANPEDRFSRDEAQMVIILVIGQNIPRVTSWFVFPFENSFPFFSFYEYYNHNDTEKSQHFQYCNRLYAPFHIRTALLFGSKISVTCCKMCFIWIGVIGSRQTEVLHSTQYIQRVNILCCRQINAEAKT